MKLSILLQLSTAVLCIQADNSSLRLVQLVFRHGDRTPVVKFPKDVYKNFQWPQGLGWLTVSGMQRHYKFGQWLRQRYNGFLNSTYLQSQIKIDSSNENRCLMSAYSNLAGLYPPSGTQVWNDKILWQPIPVHTRPKADDNVINMGMACPRYDQLYKEVIQSKEVQDMEKENKDFYSFLTKNSGLNININNLWKVEDTVLVEDQNNMTGNTWVYQNWPKRNTTVFDELRRLDSIQFHLLYKGKEISKLKGGPLLKEMIDNMVNVTKGIPSKNMFIFSGHDTTVAAFLSALELFKHFPSPPYSAGVLVELHEPTTGHFHVNLFYKQNSTYAQPLTLEGCSTDCPLDDFIRLLKDVIPTDWNSECENSPHHSHKHHVLTIPEIISIVLAVVLLVTLVCLIIACCKLKKGGIHHYKGFSDVAS